MTSQVDPTNLSGTDQVEGGTIPGNLRSADRFQPKPVLWLITAVAVALSLFQLYTAGIKPLGLFYQRTAHLGFVLFLAFLIFPVFGQTRRRGVLGWVIDAGFLTAAFLSGFYIIWYLDDIIARAGWWTSTDVMVGIICIIAVLEASRRAVGLGLTVIGALAILYALAGPRGALPGLGEWMPGVLAHRGASVDRLVGQLYLGQEGIFGLPLGVAATFVFMFVLFGAFLEKTGAGKFFIDLAFAATGRKPGGPAKAAVIASAGMGSISGSAIANVVTTGAFTIPLMKRLGYKPKQAGGIEAAASTGGQITPPLMGAGAFLISEYTRVPYIEIVMVSIFPAILYLGTVYLFVHIVAMKQGMKGMSPTELPIVRQVLKAGWQFIVPLVLLVWLLVNNISPMRVGFWAILSVIGVAGLRGVWALWADGPLSSARIQASIMRGLRMIFESLELGARNAVAVSIACAVAGIIVGVVGLTGLGLKFSSMMISLSGGNIVIALGLVLIASLILGLGLPVTASYIVLIVLVGPALHNEFGIPLLIAHLVVFWYSQDSNVTPPVALAGFAGAAVAGAKPMETSVQAWKFAKGLYLIPAFMVFNPVIITGGEMWHVLLTGTIIIIALVAFAAAIEGYLFTWIDPVSRLAMVPAVIAVFHPSLSVELAGAGALLALLGWNWLQARRSVTA
ncbi:TRAP transporter permease [Roseinatronobacter bogoriensis]|uniref:Permease n=1 Tax=Roseinatronobacter bogoriensis subsp. barguzinensis TaxID=441209 RepID=A0A2K8KJZ6_9RHOB|nr:MULTISPECIES: TRAP transporter permease [Rhodobaca]ATX66640.1 permease [Rhodobaca barguzinensis]MBB4207820.1 TRAP transporter 4TM/12TM fusion protein [Rhodobaca bogoriensis DSM 18756]TDW39874.1 TRAP transporter 4TM/12TM fusion protein [Rhodobaca barguzinensis]TDY70973.1 TRAP transporter 4TM/12TM fusion protein [Rhodobaca bogoriensis DSM 18756]